MTRKAWRSRIARAGLIVAALIAVAALGGQIEENAAAKEFCDAHDVGIRSSNLIGGLSPDALIERLEETAGVDGSDLPRYFINELGLIEGARDVRVSDRGDTVGCVVDRSPSEVMGAISNLMGQRGWTEVPLGNGEGATFVKEDGVCSWALVTCTKVGNATSVVYRCVIA